MVVYLWLIGLDEVERNAPMTSVASEIMRFCC